MDRWIFSRDRPTDEIVHFTVQDTRLYDGDQKTNYKNGVTVITSHAIRFGIGNNQIEIPLRLVILCSTLPGSWTEKERVELNLQSWETGTKPPGPVARSNGNVVRISMKKHAAECCEAILTALQLRVWEARSNQSVGVLTPTSNAARGVGGILKSKEIKKTKESNLSEHGLKDLNALMQHARELKNLASQTSQKIEKKINFDEATKLRGMIMSLGLEEDLDDSGQNQLESEIARVSHPILRLQGGIILLEDIYCAVNRARGTQLVSPEEVMAAARNIQDKYPQGGLVYQKYSSGVQVLKDASLSDKVVADRISNMILDYPSGLSAESYAMTSSLSPIVAREQLFLAEHMGHICRDDSDRGTFFFLNQFLLE